MVGFASDRRVPYHAVFNSLDNRGESIVTAIDEKNLEHAYRMLDQAEGELENEKFLHGVTATRSKELRAKIDKAIDFLDNYDGDPLSVLYGILDD